VLRRRLGRNTLYKIIGEAGSRALALAFYIFFARWIGAHDFGLYSFGLSYANIFMAVVDLGSNAIVTRELARDRSRLAEVVRHVNAMKILSAAVALGLMAASLAVFPAREGLERLILLMGLFVVGTGFLEYFCAVLSGLERMDVEAGLKIFSKVLWFLGGGLGYYFHRSLSGAVGGMLVGFAAGLVLGYAALARLGAPWGAVWDWNWQRRMLQQSAPMFAAWIFWLLYDNQDVVLLSFLGAPLAEVGIFAAAARLIDVLRVAPVLLTGAVFPVLSDYSKTKPDDHRRLARHLLLATAGAAVGFAAVISLGGGVLMRAVYGPDFASGGVTLAVLAWALVGIFVNHAAINLLITLDAQRVNMAGAAFVMAVNLIASLVLIPRYGARGAAAALLVSEAAYLGFNAVFLRRKGVV